MRKVNPLLLAIETSCDETAAALVRADGSIVAETLVSQIDAHKPYGGVVPEIAARQHIDHLDHLLRDLFQSAGLKPADVDAVAATTGPGLIGGLIVGVMTAKSIAAALNKPFIAVNHLEGHALTARLTNGVEPPFLLLLVSGGHCQILDVASIGTYHRIGTTIDDAAGEAFDKTAKLLGLAYPGGPAIEKAAQSGDAARFRFPKPLKGKPGCDFSFSGLKTALRRAAETCVAEHGVLRKEDVADLAASFQAAVADHIEDRMARAIETFRSRHSKDARFPLVVAGGVAANTLLRSRLENLCAANAMDFEAPPLKYCTDNAVMIAWAALEQLALDPARDDMDMAPRPRWPLDSAAEGKIGGGKKGVKA